MSATTLDVLLADHDVRPPLVIRDHWMAALKLYATGATAEDFRAEADSPARVKGLALLCGITQEQERAQALAIAGAIDNYAAAGLTPEQAYSLAGLDRELGPYEDNANFAAVTS